MSNMLFCVSVMFRLKLPILIIFNKADCAPHREEVENWLKHYDKFLVISSGVA